VSVREPQPILSVPTEAAIFLILTALPGSDAEIAELLADVPGVKRSVGFRVPEAELSCVVGIGAAFWDRDQELIIGRTKLADLELPDDVKPANSHLALNVITGPDGEERQIMRFNMPFGRVGADEFGTYYIAYARTSELIEQMLTNMFIGNPPGNTDRILDFSTAVTGSLFFVPAAGLLEDLHSAETPGVSDAGAPSPTREPNQGSLGIGSLRDQSR
jgi:deferrochelatase/peroxidase EfeB